MKKQDKMSKNWKIWISVIFILAVISSMIIVTYNDKTTSPYIIFIPKSKMNSNDFWFSVKTGVETAAKENNVTLEIMEPIDETHIEEQNALIIEAIDKKPDAILIAPTSRTENAEELLQVKKAGISIIYIDSVTDEKIADSIVATDNVEAGKKMAEPMLADLQKDSKIAIVSHVKNASTAIEREMGFRKGLGQYASQIVEVVYSNSSDEIGYKVTRELLEREPDISYLACLNEDSAVGAARAVKALGLEKKICLVGFDNSTEEIKQLEEGVFQAIVVQKAFSMGYFGLENAVKVVQGEYVPYSVDSGAVLVTKQNMYDEENQELLFPFY